jgi:hypothetical protein
MPSGCKRRMKKQHKHRNTMKSKTIDELCKKDAGSFKKFTEQKEKFLQGLESERKERIRASRKTALELSWAA